MTERCSASATRQALSGKGGLFKREVGARARVDGVSFDLAKGETLGSWAIGLRQVDEPAGASCA